MDSILVSIVVLSSGIAAVLKFAAAVSRYRTYYGASIVTSIAAIGWWWFSYARTFLGAMIAYAVFGSHIKKLRDDYEQLLTGTVANALMERDKALNNYARARASEKKISARLKNVEAELAIAQAEVRQLRNEVAILLEENKRLKGIAPQQGLRRFLPPSPFPTSSQVQGGQNAASQSPASPTAHKRP